MKLRGLASVGLLTDKMVVAATISAKTRVQPIMPNTGSFTYWYLQVPNLILLAMMALLVVRLVLSLVLSSGSGVMRPVGAITYPVVATVGAVTPRIVPAAGIVVCAIVWLAAIRTGLVMVALAMGIRL